MSKGTSVGVSSMHGRTLVHCVFITVPVLGEWEEEDSWCWEGEREDSWCWEGEEEESWCWEDEREDSWCSEGEGEDSCSLLTSQSS